MTRSQALEMIEDQEMGTVEIVETLLDEGFDLEDIDLMFKDLGYGGVICG